VSLLLSFIGIAILVGVFAWYSRRRRETATSTITVSQMGAVFAGLGAAQSSPAFAIFTFTTPERPHVNDAIDLQLFKENGQMGFDWPLSTPRNLQDEERFLEFARAAGFLSRLMETNGIRHYRIDDGDLLTLCTDVITRLYGVPPDRPIELIVEGFEWRAVSAPALRTPY
jgi:hypothetical protein